METKSADKQIWCRVFGHTPPKAVPTNYSTFQHCTVCSEIFYRPVSVYGPPVYVGKLPMRQDIECIYAK